MDQTPLHHGFNAELLALIPRDAKRLVEVGCSSGALAREYRKLNPHCEYLGLEIDPGYAEIARAHCSRVMVGNIEHLSDADFTSLAPADCWIFGDVLEHLFDPWAVLRRVRAASLPTTSVLACIPNAQHWSVQVRLNAGEFRYEDMGLLDRTHIRWFTRRTVIHLFASTGFQIASIGNRVLRGTEDEPMLEGVREMAEAMGTDADIAVSDAIPFQWIVRAVPSQAPGAGADAGHSDVKQTPLRDYFNPDLLAIVPKGAARVVEVGCGNGAMAREYRKVNPHSEYIGIEIVPEYAEASRAHCTRVITGNIEQMSDGEFRSLFPSTCWIFSDVLEHLHDPWGMLRRIRALLEPTSSVIACIPNAQHWTVQALLNQGEFWYKDLGLFDRTHIRWFTKRTIGELFSAAGFEIVEGGGLMVDEQRHQQLALAGVRALAMAIGTDPEEAVTSSLPMAWIVRAMPAATQASP